MRDLTLLEYKEVSGADYGVCTIDDYMPDFTTIDYNYQSPMLLFSEAMNAAFWGCGAALVSGRGVMGCVIGGGAAAGAKTMSFFIQDAYWMYQSAASN